MAAEAQIILAEASKRSISLVTEAIGDQEMPVVYLLGEKYINSLQALSASDNAKSVVFPADIPTAIRGLMGKS
jgi:regulator of protease activity HflC (stomatin/prohibitin superfamily)